MSMEAEELDNKQRLLVELAKTYGSKRRLFSRISAVSAALVFVSMTSLVVFPLFSKAPLVQPPSEDQTRQISLLQDSVAVLNTQKDTLLLALNGHKDLASASVIRSYKQALQEKNGQLQRLQASRDSALRSVNAGNGNNPSATLVAALRDSLRQQGAQVRNSGAALKACNESRRRVEALVAKRTRALDSVMVVLRNCRATGGKTGFVVPLRDTAATKVKRRPEQLIFKKGPLAPAQSSPIK